MTVGSNSNVGENGLDKETGRAAIWEYTIATKQMREYAPACATQRPRLRARHRRTLDGGERARRDRSDLVPDYITSVARRRIYGWPYSYWGQHVDARVQPQRPDLVAKALAPDYAVGTHTASLGMAFLADEQPA